MCEGFQSPSCTTKNGVCGGDFNMAFQKKCHIILYKTKF